VLLSTGRPGRRRRLDTHAVLSLREVRNRREVPFALLPALFAAHQLTESLVWLGLAGTLSATTQASAALVYLWFALPVLPVLVPLSVILLEPPGARLRVAPFLALGAVVAAYLGTALATSPVAVVQRPHSLSYETGVSNGATWAVLYVIAVIGPALLSGYRTIVAFGVLNLAGLTVVAILLSTSFASVWCVYAALASVLILVAMRRRHRRPDPHRIPAPA